MGPVTAKKVLYDWPEVEAEIETDTETGLTVETLQPREIVLNASRLKVESETG